MKCNRCPRKCNAERTDTENTGGFCRQPLLPKIARAALHYWEEPVISGKNGSGTVFFSGCNLGCIYCQNAEISHGGKGKTVSPEELSLIFKKLEDAGAHNINLVTPTHFTDAVKAALDIYKPSVPIVYNSGGYESVATLKSLEKYVDIYLLDFKYLSPLKAKKYSFAEDYPEVAKEALAECFRQKGSGTVKNGIMEKGVIVRHMLLPQSTNDAIGIFDYVKENANGVYFSLMSQYIPLNDAVNDAVINRRVTKREYEKVTDYILGSGYQNCFIQSRTSADEKYIPDFDFTGV